MKVADKRKHSSNGNKKTSRQCLGCLLNFTWSGLWLFTGLAVIKKRKKDKTNIQIKESLNLAHSHTYEAFIEDRTHYSLVRHITFLVGRIYMQ